MNINYKIEAMNILLKKDCILERYYPLIIKKDDLIKYLLSIKCYTKEECLSLKDDKLIKSPLANFSNINLFKKFLKMYDINNSKLSTIKRLTLSDKEIISYKQLYLLPGVKETRAWLYYGSGFKNLNDIAKSSSDEIIARTNLFIKKMDLDIKSPLVKEAKTHIAVAKVFTEYKID